MEEKNIGFVSTRLAGTDGVSLETRKWVTILEEMGYPCFFFTGESEWPSERSYVLSEAHFDHPEILKINRDLFDNYTRSPETSASIHHLRSVIKEHLYAFVEKFNLDALIVENALAIPMNIPLGLAITELVAETDIPTIGHHHDFGWERSRFKVSAASDLQLGAFPPILHAIKHVVINSYGARQLALRTGATSTLIPNVMNFENPPPEPDDYASTLRSDLDIPESHTLVLQPTRVVPRKRIELAMELVRRLGPDTTMLITHAAGDEGNNYERYLRTYASILKINVIFSARRFNHARGRTAEGDKIFSLRDAYQACDIVSYPSTIEGFGNAFLEAIYYARPIVISEYEIFRTDIEPKGFRVIGFSNFINDDCVRQARQVLANPELASEMASHNFEVGRRHYSFRILKHRLQDLLLQTLGNF